MRIVIIPLFNDPRQSHKTTLCANYFSKNAKYMSLYCSLSTCLIDHGLSDKILFWWSQFYINSLHILYNKSIKHTNQPTEPKHETKNRWSWLWYSLFDSKIHYIAHCKNSILSPHNNNFFTFSQRQIRRYEMNTSQPNM
jgi:hypothetical protein